MKTPYFLYETKSHPIIQTMEELPNYLMKALLTHDKSLVINTNAYTPSST